MIDASRDNYGNIPAWNLVANAVAAPSVPAKPKSACAEKMFIQVNARDCDALCKNYAAENNCDIHKSGSVTTTNMVACYCNPANTVTLDEPNRRASGFSAAAGLIGGF